MICIQEAFHEHVVWFLDEAGEPKENHIEFGSFYDGYNIQGVLATNMMTIVIFNIPWLIHCPEFNWILSIFKAGETSVNGLIWLTIFQTELIDLLSNGLLVEFAGFPDNKLIPGTKRKLNGVHRWTFGYLYRRI
jgi:hypothetical protein